MFIFIYLIIFCCTCKNGTDYIDSKQSKHGGDHATAFDSWDFGSFTAGDTMISKCKKLNKEERRHTAWQAQRAPLKKIHKRRNGIKLTRKTSKRPDIRKIQNTQHIGSELTSLRASVTTNREYTNHLL